MPGNVMMAGDKSGILCALFGGGFMFPKQEVPNADVFIPVCVHTGGKTSIIGNKNL